MTHGLLVVFSAPSGCGKSTVINEVMKLKENEYKYSLSATTRLPRGSERNGEHYIFLTESEFLRLREENEFLEWAVVHGNLYGTPRTPIEKSITNNEIVLLDIDVQGGLEVKKQLKEKAFLIFLAPPSLPALEERLRKRQTDSDEVIQKRLLAVPAELAKADEYDVVVVNDDLKKTVEQVLQTIERKINEQ
ncbi:MAG: guanylate kinase [Deferribacteres bacterium]|nr:guanylate kinase [candidate division KSB1 bacterium]MCB9501490.1 guanylate kinase [Deferribacteres bacterium]